MDAWLTGLQDLFLRDKREATRKGSRVQENMVPHWHKEMSAGFKNLDGSPPRDWVWC